MRPMKVIQMSRDMDRAGIPGSYGCFDAVIDAGWIVPGLDTKFVPQGICWLPGGRGIAIASYHYSRKKPSRVVIVDVDGGEVRRQFSLRDDDGEPYFGHAGGMAVHGPWLWVCSGGRARRFALADVDKDGTDLVAAGGFDADSRCSFMSSDGERLWLGEFRHGDFKTARHHRCSIDDDKRAWVAGYDVDADSGVPREPPRYEVDGTAVHAPSRVLFIRNRVQGMAVCGKRLALSISYGSADSRLALYKNPFDAKPFDVELPKGVAQGFVVNADTNYIGTFKMPAGAQDLDWDGQRLLTVFEGGSKVYLDRWRLEGAVIEDRAIAMRLPNRKELETLLHREWTVGAKVGGVVGRAGRVVLHHIEGAVRPVLP